MFVSRRNVIKQGVAAAVCTGLMPALARASDGQALIAWLRGAEFAQWVRDSMKTGHVAGLSLAVLDEGRVVHTAGFGHADIATGRAMTPDTVMNIASVTKTITCTAVMQLHEQGKLDLDAPIDERLPLKIRNPAFAGRLITTRQLLTHTSSIADGPAYEASYACGDPQIALGDWLTGYFTPGGAHYDAKTNFHAWAPGGTWSYSNVAYGVLGWLVERVSGQSYAQYCAEHIFTPLGMNHCRFLLAGMDRTTHATLYSYVDDGRFTNVGVVDPSWTAPKQGAALVPHCLYSFVTMSDGLARCSAAELARFVMAYAQGGSLDGARILKPDTVRQILRDQRVHYAEPKPQIQGLTWRGRDARWGHTGADPGVATGVEFRPSDGRGLVVLTNISGAKSFSQILERVF
ncbi:serine hydrolase domain-containing protein [Steroidobacter sp.]|uniref:serine hydrolase domain-containing protein n=1 Tax=Steroidobacter sp. TaxID=1978227 RepID=UPI001A430335|nr:serine hydrolase domain-containing protein [Steroidobacter sp.]MBL8270526.1 beta-lactamase family protein [Steroidobacter sp.]